MYVFLEPLVAMAWASPLCSTFHLVGVFADTKGPRVNPITLLDPRPPALPRPPANFAQLPVCRDLSRSKSCCYPVYAYIL